MEKIMHKKLNKISALFLTIAVALWCMAGLWATVLTAKAADTGSLTLWCIKDDDIVVNMHWQIYRVGYRSNDDYIFEGGFAGYRATLGDKTKPMLEWDTETVAAAGEALKKKTIANKIVPRADGYTNSSGAVTFDGLENGLYLVWGDILKVGDITYIPSAIFFEVSGEDANVLNAYPKIVLRTLSEISVNHSVRKIWENDEYQPWNRAVSIIVERYRDNQYYDDIELSEKNNWTFEWEDEAVHTWFVYEKVIPEHYTVSYKDNHTQYLIINTFESPSDSSSDTDIRTTATTDGNRTDTQTTTTNIAADNGTDTTSVNTTALNGTDIKTSTNPINNTTANKNSTPNNNTTPNNSSTRTTSVQTTVTEEKLPQTGQLWWPVPCLAVGGLLFFGVGLKITKKDDEE